MYCIDYIDTVLCMHNILKKIIYQKSEQVKCPLSEHVKVIKQVFVYQCIVYTNNSFLPICWNHATEQITIAYEKAAAMLMCVWYAYVQAC